MKNLLVYFYIICLCTFTLNISFGQTMAVTLSNPVAISMTQIQFDINVQNTSSDGETLAIMTAAIQQRTTNGPLPSGTLSISLEPGFSALSFGPQVTVSSGQTILRLNAGTPAATPAPVPTSETKLGTVTYTTISNMTLPGVSIGSTVAAPNVQITASVNGSPSGTTFSLAQNNLTLSNAATVDPIIFGAPLPIKISSLDAYASGKSNVITWTTESEINNQYQIVETSYDGFSGWTEVGRIKARNSVNNASYNILDRKPSQINYYRIHSIDFDGRSEYSSIVAVNRHGDRSEDISLKIYPNPATNIINVDLTDMDLHEGIIHLSVYDNTGKAIISKEVNGAGIEPIQASNMAAGSYQVVVKQGDTTHRKQIIVVN
jgi:hypothetical protein